MHSDTRLVSSFLSPAVAHRLSLLDDIDGLDDDDGSLRGIVDAEHGAIDEQCFSALIELNSSKDYVDLTRSLLPFMRRCHRTEAKKVLTEFDKNLIWLSDPVAFASSAAKCIDASAKSVLTVEALTLMTPIIERSLGDVIRSTDEQIRVPALLSELVSAPELQSVIGSANSLLLKLLFGSPKSLNVRNLIWHGFCGSNELHPCLVSTLVVIASSIGAVLRLRQVRVARRQLRPLGGRRVLIVLADQAADIDQTQLCAVHRVRQPMLDCALAAMASGDHALCLCMLLIELEFSLRVAFVTCNSCPARLLTAETDELYTTLTEMLRPNAMTDGLSEHVLELLFDLLVLPNGPRLRDRLSHGEVALNDADFEPWCRILVLCLGAIQELVQQSGSYFTNTLGSYKSLYHPCGVASFHILTSLNELRSLQERSLPQLAHLDIDSSEVCLIQLSQQCSNHLVQIGSSASYDRVDQVIADVSEQLQSVHLKTLFRPAWEVSLVSALARVAERASLAVGQVLASLNAFLALNERDALRIRQRSAFRKMLLVCHEVSGSLLTAVLLATGLLINVELAELRQDEIAKKMRRLQKACENVARFVRFETNKWDEAADLAKEILKVTEYDYSL